LRAKVSVFAELYRKTRELEMLNQDLERRVEERTAALEESMARERQARLAAEAAIQVCDDFLSIAAHELKTPLAGLRVTAQTALRKLAKGGTAFPDWLEDSLHTVITRPSVSRA
jgi:signal transduction histidine kinase